MKPYSRPQKQHDYTWEQDYILHDPTPEMDAILTRSMCDVEDLLPKISIFAGYSCTFVEDLEDNTLGKYIDGTVSHPYIALNWDVLKNSADENYVDISMAISTTIVHELGHAIQEALGLKRETQDSEDQAERLAEHWYHHRELSNEFKILLNLSRN